MAQAPSTLAQSEVDARPARRRRSRREVNTLPLLAPAVIVLLLWMVVPLGLTLWFSGCW
jgi:sorbitol/mannitol transport system permease protein